MHLKKIQTQSIVKRAYITYMVEKNKKNKPAQFRTRAGLNKLKAKNDFCIRSSIRSLLLIYL